MILIPLLPDAITPIVAILISTNPINQIKSVHFLFFKSTGPINKIMHFDLLNTGLKGKFWRIKEII